MEQQKVYKLDLNDLIRAEAKNHKGGKNCKDCKGKNKCHACSSSSSTSSCPPSSSSSCTKCEIHGESCTQKVCVKKNCEDQCECLNPNVKKAKKLFREFVHGIQNNFDLTKFLEHVDESFTFIIHDRTDTIPFAGCFDLCEFRLTFGSPTGAFANTVSAFDATISNVYLSCNFSKILIVANVQMTVQCAPGSTQTESLCGPFFIFFSFDGCNNLIKVDIFLETGPLVQFFENCPV